MIFAFDFDGTIVDSTDFIYSCWWTALANYGLVLKDSSEMGPYYGPNEKGVLMNALGEERGKEAYEKIFLKRYEEGHEEGIGKLDERYREIFAYIKAKGDHIVLLSGRGEETTKISFDKLGLNGVFERLYLGPDRGRGKQKNLLKLMKDYRVDNTKVIYIGDTRNDVTYASSVGVKTISISVKDYDGLEKINPGMVVRNLDELFEMIKKFA
jgi:phosphoglycolate phosphatase-like HAD superfamily hydrolase